MRWSSHLPTRFLVSRRTSQHPSPHTFKYRTLTFFGRLSHAVLLVCGFVTIMVLGSSAFARRYQRNRFYFLFLQVLRYFSSLRFPSAYADAISSIWRVSPFGFPRIVAYLLLPVAFRRQLRPSSALSAQASTVRPFFLNLFYSFIFFTTEFIYFSKIKLIKT